MKTGTESGARTRTSTFMGTGAEMEGERGCYKGTQDGNGDGSGDGAGRVGER